jgi:hypothetical protein
MHSLRIARLRWAILLAAATPLVVVAATVLYSYSPTSYGFYPPCLFHTLTSLHCPGCGSTRCVHALLHGDFRQAAAYNMLLVVSLPFLAVWVVRKVWTLITPQQPATWLLPSWTIRLIFWVIVTFWVLRNVHAVPFSLLAPHELQ